MATTTEQAELQDVSGPSALGGGWRRSLDLLYLMAVTEFKRTYFGTALGYVWTVARPLMLFGVLLLVFNVGFKVGAHIHNYAVVLLLNLVLFWFFQEATNTAVPSIVAQEAVVRKTQFPRLVIPLAVVLNSLFNLCLNLVVVFVFILAFGIAPAWTWLLMIPLIAALTLLSVAVAMIVSSLYPRLRDLGIIWSVISTALFYGTPVIYTLQFFSGHPTLQHILALNPLTPILELARRWVIDPHALIVGGIADVIGPIAIMLATFALAVWVFRREAPRIAEAL
jgi:ABC-2 type transport system permease protein